MSKVKIAIIGIGKIATDQHLPVATESPDFELAAVVSQRGTGYGTAAVFRTPEELYRERPDIQVVAFCTPPSNRHQLVTDALRNGKHVLMEKPPTPTLSELLDLELLATQERRVLFATWHCQFNPSIERARDIIKRDGFRSIHITWRESVWRWHPGQDWIWEVGGFGVFDPGINALSILTAITPAMIHVRACELEIPANRNTAIAARISMATTDGDPVTADFDWRQRTDEIWDVAIQTRAGDKLRISRGGGELRINDELVISGPKREYQGIYAEFARLLEAGQSSVDAAPLRLTADAHLVGSRTIIEPFNW